MDNGIYPAPNPNTAGTPTFILRPPPSRSHKNPISTLALDPVQPQTPDVNAASPLRPASQWHASQSREGGTSPGHLGAPVPRPPARVSASDTTGVSPSAVAPGRAQGLAPRGGREGGRGKSGFFFIWDVCQIAVGRARCKRGYCKVHIRFRGPSGGRGSWWALRTGQYV